MTSMTAEPHATNFRSLRRGVALFLAHVVPAIAIADGVPARDWVLCLLLYVHGGLVASVCLHRYYAHRAFRTSKTLAAFLALNACTTFTDPLEFAGKHRVHHHFADRHGDVHRPTAGLWQCWLGSVINHGCSDAELLARTRDLVQEQPYLVALHRFRWVVTSACAGACYWFGGFSSLAIGFVLSRVLMLHASSLLNYSCHKWGPRPFRTADESRNLAIVSLFTFGEGWHNTHHRFPDSARVGLLPGQVDVAFWVIRGMQTLGLAHDVRCADVHAARSEAARTLPRVRRSVRVTSSRTPGRSAQA